jgi:hypothetical protein
MSDASVRANRIRKNLLGALFGLLATFAVTFSIFWIFEGHPSLVPHVMLHQVKYYARRWSWVPDPKLVFVYRNSGSSHLPAEPIQYLASWGGGSYGNMYSGDEGVSVQQIRYSASYNEWGFRANSSGSPFDAVVIGDSYIEIGEDDRDTFSERLKAASGLATFNLGRGYYGPYQYLELFKRYGLALRPKFAILCFYAGNDASDVSEYKRWIESGQYYSFRDSSRMTFMGRYLWALSDTGAAIGDALGRWWYGRPGHGFDPDLGIFQIGNEKVALKLDDDQWNSPGTPEELLSTEPWIDLKSILDEFRRLTVENAITPIVVYLPTTIQVYGEYFTGEGGRGVIGNIQTQLRNASNSADALGILTGQLKIQYVNLLPVFQCAASQGKLLDYPFDNHWNREGREVAAEYVAAFLGGTTKDLKSLDCASGMAQPTQK